MTNSALTDMAAATHAAIGLGWRLFDAVGWWNATVSSSVQNVCEGVCRKNMIRQGTYKTGAILRVLPYEG